MLEMALDINPQLDVRVFDHGLDAGNLDAFLAGGDLYLDGLDFFALAIRREVFARCESLRIPAVTKLLLERGPVIAAPRGLHFDAFRNRLAHTWRPGGNHHPLQRLLLRLGRRRLKQRHAQACP